MTITQENFEETFNTLKYYEDANTKMTAEEILKMLEREIPLQVKISALIVASIPDNEKENYNIRKALSTFKNRLKEDPDNKQIRETIARLERELQESSQGEAFKDEKRIKKDIAYLENELKKNPDDESAKGMLERLTEELKNDEYCYKYDPDLLNSLNESKLKERLIFLFSPYLVFLEENNPNEFKQALDIIEENVKKYSGMTASNIFSYILQGTAVNKYSKITPRLEDFTINKFDDTATYEKDNFSIKIFNISKLSDQKTSTKKLFDALLEKFTNDGRKSEEILLPLKDFMLKRGLKDEKSAREQIKADLEILSRTKITFTQKLKGGRTRDYFNLGLVQSSQGIKNGIIIAYLDTAFVKLLKTYSPMPITDLSYQLSDKYNPNSYYFLRAISIHKNMNYAKKNANIISVRALLASSPLMPTYKEVYEKGNYRYNERIIEPFERDMDALNEVLTWEYCHSNGMPLTDDELQNFNYEIFSKLLVKIHWHNYPEREVKPKKLPTKKKENKISNNKKSS